MPTLLFQSPSESIEPVRCEVPPGLDPMDDDAFFAFCQENRDLRIERSSSGEIVIMAPTGFDSGRQNADIVSQLFTWAKADGRGIVGESSTGYILPNGAERAPDASWILRSRVDTVPAPRRQKFLPLCPDFAIELRSPSDRLVNVQAKLEEYIENGAGLGWLIDPIDRAVHIYRPGKTPEVIGWPERVEGEEPVRGFVLDLTDLLSPAERVTLD